MKKSTLSIKEKIIANKERKIRFSNNLMNHKKIGRNDICHCGGKIKYKKCCGR